MSRHPHDISTLLYRRGAKWELPIEAPQGAVRDTGLQTCVCVCVRSFPLTRTVQPVTDDVPSLPAPGDIAAQRATPGETKTL